MITGNCYSTLGLPSTELGETKGKICAGKLHRGFAQFSGNFGVETGFAARIIPCADGCDAAIRMGNGPSRDPFVFSIDSRSKDKSFCFLNKRCRVSDYNYTPTPGSPIRRSLMISVPCRIQAHFLKSGFMLRGKYDQT